MSGSSNIVVMRRVVQQLRFEASINRVKVRGVGRVIDPEEGVGGGR